MTVIQEQQSKRIDPLKRILLKFLFEISFLNLFRGHIKKRFEVIEGNTINVHNGDCVYLRN